MLTLSSSPFDPKRQSAATLKQPAMKRRANASHKLQMLAASTGNLRHAHSRPVACFTRRRVHQSASNDYGVPNDRTCSCSGGTLFRHGGTPAPQRGEGGGTAPSIVRNPPARDSIRPRFALARSSLNACQRHAASAWKGTSAHPKGAPIPKHLNLVAIRAESSLVSLIDGIECPLYRCQRS